MQIEISDVFQKDYEVTPELQVPTKNSDFNYHDYVTIIFIQPYSVKIYTQILKKC